MIDTETANYFIQDLLDTPTKAPMNDQEIREEFVKALSDAAYQSDDIRADSYSGRGMYGSSCFALKGDLRDIMSIVFDVIAEEEDQDMRFEFAALAENFQVDSLGLSSVVYWRGLEYKGEEEDEEDGEDD